MTTSTYLVRCGTARVAVHGDNTVVKPLLDACHPWFTATPCPQRPPTGLWTIRLDARPRGRAMASRTGTAVHLEPDQRTLHLPPPSAPAAARPHIRLLRALLRRQLAAHGEVFLPAALLSIHDRGLALLGPTHTGKTSTLLATLHRRDHSRFVANDDSSLHLRTGTVLGRGYPRAVEVRHATLPHLGAAAGPLAAAAQPDSPDDALCLHPHQVAIALGTGLASDVPLVALVVLGTAPTQPTLTRLTPDDAEQALTTHADDADPYETWLAPYFPTARTPRTHLSRIARTVPTWHLAQPLTALPRSAELLAQLATHPGGHQ
ncbi:hypothetical protein [Streptomyces triculaminicus]|uniref:hypothetical protein n=1 Tax=Streptomyces triculaminicus TaxID=2816232 RepID=UPI0037D6F316